MTIMRTFTAAVTAAILLSCAVPYTASAQVKPLREEVEALNAAMVAALKKDPASVARFYTDDASILGGGSRYVGRAEVDQYWRDATMFADWTLEVTEVGGDGQTPWVRGRSTLHGKSGRRMATEYIGLLKRGPDGQLRFYVDMFVAAAAARPAGGAQ
jgi:ketosteroid isomerase-like protein